MMRIQDLSTTTRCTLSITPSIVVSFMSATTMISSCLTLKARGARMSIVRALLQIQELCWISFLREPVFARQMPLFFSLGLKAGSTSFKPLQRSTLLHFPSSTKRPFGHQENGSTWQREKCAFGARQSHLLCVQGCHGA